jgi:murein DD-endopeptidase MepM/ murein hydrolase activator NlpD
MLRLPAKRGELVWRMHTLSAQSRSQFSAAFADLGLEPAIEPAGSRQRPLDQRRVSLRWLCGTILTGLAGAALISAATYAALDRQSYFAEAPMPAAPLYKESAYGINPHKGDRLVKSIDIIADKQTFKAPTTIKMGDKEVVKVHSFTHIETNLLMTSAGFADDVPPFNPLQLLADARNPVDQSAAPDEDDDGDVSWSTRDLPVENVSLAAGLSPDEVQAQVEEQIKSTLAAGNEPFTLPPQLLLMRTSRANPLGALAYANPNDPISTVPFSQIEVRMVPENVTVVPRGPAVQPTQMEERLIVLRHGDTLESALKTAGVGQEAIDGIVAAFAPKRGEPVVPEGRRLKLLMADLDGSGTNMSLARLSVYNDEMLETAIAITDRGDYVRVEDDEPEAKNSTDDDSADNDDNGMQLYDSFYETALKQNIPKPIIDELIRIFANDVDFQRPASSGDSFEALYDNGEDGEQRNELLYAAIVARNETYRYYRYQTPDDGLVDFYDENGKSSRKFLIRTPIIGAKMTSPFGMRFHPILGYTRLHTGVDWGAAVGTPVFAAGNGQIITAGWDAGYGRRIEIQHANGYETTYNHLSGFARGIREGVQVKQGQVIGYLGETGLATGPHLHYEVLVNGHFVDPMRVKLARTREFDGKILADFKRERDQIDALVERAPNSASLVASRQDK